MSINQRTMSAADLADRLTEIISDAGGTIERLNARVAELEGNLAARDFTINDMCDEIFTLQQQLEAVKRCA